LITGIAHIGAGYVQTTRNEIAYYQQSIIIWMAAMGFGPAAIAWLRRAHGRTDKVFFIFTVSYAAIMFGFSLYANARLTNDPFPSSLPLDCFLDVETIPDFYKKGAMHALNIVSVSITVGVIVVSAASNLFYRKYRPTGYMNWFASRPAINSIWERCVVFFVLLIEVLLFIMVWETASHYRDVVPEAQQQAEGVWSFGQIIPFMMLLFPILLGFRAAIEGDVIRHVEDQLPATSTITTTVTTDNWNNGVKFGAR
jgi:hypothetical protein